MMKKSGWLWGLVLTCTLPLGAQPWVGFERGMGIGGWLTNYKRFNVLPVEKRLVLTPGDYAHFKSYITEGDVIRIKRWGFDHIRLGFDQVVLEERPGVWREENFRHLDDFVSWCAKHKLNVVLNLHKAIGNYCDIPEKIQLLDDATLQDRFVALWMEIERRYHNRPNLAFELLNEVRNVEAQKWNQLANRTLKAIRQQNPTRWVVIGSICWNSADRLKDLSIWDDAHVVYTFHTYAPFGFTHQRGVLQQGPLFDNAEVPYPGSAEIQRALAPAVAWAKAHPDKILWNGEFGTIRHTNPLSRVRYMRDVIAVCQQNGISYCVWNYLSTPNDGNRFSLVDDDTRDFLSNALLRACLGKDAPEQLTFMTFNIWGAYGKNVACERDLKAATYLLRTGPDIIALQEINPGFWQSRLFTRLAADYGIVRREGEPLAEYNPLLYRKDRLELIEGGTHVYDYKDNSEKSKGFGWGVFRDKVTGARFISYSTHLWWKEKPVEQLAAFDHMRVNNANELFAQLDTLHKKYGALPVVGGGDLNTSENVRLSGRETPLNNWLARGYCDAQYTVEGASMYSSYHGYPRRDAYGTFRIWIDAEAADYKNSLDHVHYTKKGIAPVAVQIDRNELALECSDHSPVLFTFRVTDTAH